jgi:xylulokinase
MPNGCMASSGSLLNWVARELAGGRSHADLDALAAGLNRGADGLIMLPYFLGEKTPIHDANARGTLVGSRPSRWWRIWGDRLRASLRRPAL